MIYKSRFIILALILLIIQLNCTSQKTDDRPNVILFIGDDISYNDFGCYGNQVVQTPSIDKIASEGVLFENAFVTISSCSPCRHSILTSRYPHNNGSLGLRMDPDKSLPIFTELLKKNGYYTAHAGKWHQSRSTARGYNDIYYNNHGNGGEGNWLKVVKGRPKKKPFFFWFASHDAHRIWGKNEFSGTHDLNDITPPPYLGDSDSTKKDIAQYYDEIKRLDYYIGEVEKELEKQGVLDNTILIVMADNGRPFPHCKTRVNDEGVRVPMVIKWPKGNVPAGARTQAMMSAIDLAPTILEYAGIEIPEQFQGVSVSKVLQNPEEKHRNYIFAEHNYHDFEAHERMVRDDKYLYIVNNRPNLNQVGAVDIMKGPSFKEIQALHKSGEINEIQNDAFITPRPTEELYLIAEDPMQLNNLAGDKKHADALKHMQSVLQQWIDETKDDVPDVIRSDRFSREDYSPIHEDLWIEGVRPGVESGSLKTNNKGPF